MVAQIFQIITMVLGAIVTLAFAYQAAYLFVPFLVRKKRGKRGVPAEHSYAILIAARNEEKVIGHLLDSIRNQKYPSDKITTFVVADNCTDATAEIARQAGAIVYERFNKEQIGKGYAINYLLSKIDEDYGWDSFEAYMIFDADNVLKPDYIRQMNRLCDEGYQAFTGYRNTKNFGSSWISAGHGIWYLHDSCHLSQSRMRLGLACAVTGTGFGFTRELLKEMGGWNYFTLTEDIEFSTWCCVRGIRIGYCHDAILFDEQPVKLIQSWRQRTRWAQGGIQVTLRYTKEYGKGLKKGGWIGWSTFEAITLSLWGLGLAFLSGALGLITGIMTAGVWGGVLGSVLGIVGTYFSMMAMAAWTMFTERKRIRATTGQKTKGLFSFPLYVLTWVPISFLSLFRKFEWVPIEHTEAISVDALEKK